MAGPFTVDVKQPEILKGSRLEALVLRAVNRAGGDALRTMQTVSNRKVRERKAMKAKNVRDAMTLIFPSAGGPVGDSKSASTQWRLRVKNAPTPVFAYMARQTKPGVTAAINVGPRALIRHAFIATMKSGHQGVFMRYGQAQRSPIQHGKGMAKYRGQKRQPIRELYTSKIIDVFSDPDFIPAVQDAAHAKFVETFQRNVGADLRGVTRG